MELISKPVAEKNRTEQHRTEQDRSEEHTSELQSRETISYAVFCLKKKKKSNTDKQQDHTLVDKT